MKKSQKLLSGGLALCLLSSSFQIPLYATAPSTRMEVKENDEDSLDTGLVLNFDMENLDNNSLINRADLQAFTIEGNPIQTTTSRDGHGQAMVLDGQTNYVNLGTDYQIADNQATIAAWIKIDQNPNGLSRILCRTRTAVPGEHDLALTVRNNGRMEAEVPAWIGSSDGLVSFGEWQHVAVTTDGTTETLWLNGEPVASTPAGEIDPDWTTAGLMLGGGWNNQDTGPFTGHLFKGALDDVKLYDRALSAKEIAALADAEIEDPGDVTVPEPLYRFGMNTIEDGTGDLAGSKVVRNQMDGTEYPIYGGAKVDDFGIYGKSILFNGNDSYINVGNPDIHDTYTMSSWIYLDKNAVNNMNKIFGRDRTTVASDMFFIAVRGDRQGEVDIQLDGASISCPSGTVPFGEWANLTVTNTPEQACFYINGNLIAKTKGSTADLHQNPVDLLIGCGWNASGTDIFNGHAFKGRMDDVCIYDKALNQQQIEKYTKGILEGIPPEVTAISVDAGAVINASGRLQVEFNMPITLGEGKVTIEDEEKNVITTSLSTTDQDFADGDETLIVVPDQKLEPGKRYTYHFEEGVVVNEKSVGSIAFTHQVLCEIDYAGKAAESGMTYWTIEGKADSPATIHQEDQTVIMENGLVRRSFDLEQNFLNTEYINLYTGLSVLDEEHACPQTEITLATSYKDGKNETDESFYVGGVSTDKTTFQLEDWHIEENTKEPYHWEYDYRISPSYMKDADWPAKGKALVVDYAAPDSITSAYAGVKISVRYEIYDGIPVISKSVSVTNEGNLDVIVHHLSTEVIASTESMKDVLLIDSDMNAGNNNHDRNNGQYVFREWQEDEENNGRGKLVSRYAIATDNQTNMHGLDYTNFGPNYRLHAGETFDSAKVYELFHSSSWYEWQSLEARKMYRVLFPQTQDAPLIYHCISSDPATLRTAIDQCAEAGFNMMLMSFGSGIDTENTNPAYMQRYKEVIDYAHSKDILVGAYMMLTARGGGDTHSGIWGTMRCIASDATQNTISNVLTFVDNTGLDCLEIDGSYPGSLCDGTNHPGHEGLEDSVTRQWEIGVRDFYKELRKRNVYINAPDWHYMAGASMGVMGYVEAGFNVTPMEQLIYGRSMSYYATFEKMPSMGWTLVPLSPYHGGSDSSFWPYNDKIKEYDFMVGMNMLSGVTGSYRGGNGLYQSGASERVMKNWGAFYDKYRDVLNGDTIHVAPPLPVSIDSKQTSAIDGFVHVSPDSTQKALAAFFNQTGETVTQTVKIPLFYTGLTERTSAPQPLEGSHYRISAPTRTSGPVGEMSSSGKNYTPGVPTLDEEEVTTTNATAVICIGDMDPQVVSIDSQGNAEVEITLEPDTYTWLTVYDPDNVPEDLLTSEDIPPVEYLKVKEAASSSISLEWQTAQSDDEVVEYHIFRNGEYLDKTFEPSYTDKTVTPDQVYTYEVAAVRNTVCGKTSSVQARSTSDTTAPAITGVDVLSINKVLVHFDETLDASSSQNPASWLVNGHVPAQAVLQENGSDVLLTLSEKLNTSGSNILSVSNVADLAGNTISLSEGFSFEAGLLHGYGFDEDGTTAKDSGLGQDGEIHDSSLERTEGLKDRALVFDGTETYVNLGHLVTDLDEYSISGWFKPESLKDHQSLLTQQREEYDGWKWNLEINDGKLVFVVNNGKGSYPGHTSEDEVLVELSSAKDQIRTGAWNHFVIIRDGDSWRLMLNGSLADEKEQAGIDQTESLYGIRVGAMRNNAGGEPKFLFQGAMDELNIYCNALTADKVKELYDEFAEPDEPVESTNKVLLQQAVDYADNWLAAHPDSALNPIVSRYFNEALEEARTVLANNKATQEEVNAAWQKLAYVIHLLSFTSDKAGLEELVKEAEAIDLKLYEDDDARNAFEEALAKAKAVLNSETALDASIEEAYSTLFEAMQNLHPATSIDTRLLTWLITEAEGINEEDYIADQLPAFRDALANAKAVAEAPESQEQVDEATAALHQAILNLRLKADESLLKELNQTLTLFRSCKASLFSQDEFLQIQNAINTLETALGDPEHLEAAEAQNLADSFKELSDLVKTRIDQLVKTRIDQNEELDTPDNTDNLDKPGSGSSEKNEPSVDEETKPAEQKTETTRNSVKTAASLNTALYASSAASAALLWMIQRRKRK